MTYQQYRRTQIAEMADWHEDFDMTDVSVSAEDAKAGSPKMGDKIARNPANHADRWLVAAAYFAENFEPMTTESLREQIRRAVQRATDQWAGADIGHAQLAGPVHMRIVDEACDAIEALIDEAVKEHHNVGAMHGDCGIGAVARAWGRPCPVCPRPTDFFASLPAVDEFGVPVSKMPNCPNCGADELGMLTERHVLCYACRFEVTR